MNTPEKQRMEKDGLVNLASGVIVLQDDCILFVREKNHWGLPKGGQEANEFLIETAQREALEETGFQIEMISLAFVTEFMIKGEGHYLQLYYEGKVAGGQLGGQDPDGEIQEVRFVPVAELSSYLKFRPRLLPLQSWLADRRCQYFSFRIDNDGLKT